MEIERKYKVREITPESMACSYVIVCPAIYEVEELTPKTNICAAVSCPSIYEITPKENMCLVGTCPGIYKTTSEDSKCGPFGGCPDINEYEDKYLIIGNERPSEENYDVVRVPTGILVNADKNRLRILREESGQTDVAGRRVNLKSLPKEISFLERKVGKGEILIRSGEGDL